MLFDRIISQGTINEPKGKPDPEYALPSTVNWMKALRLIIEHDALDFDMATRFYQLEGSRKMDLLVENTVFEQLLLGLHHLSSLGKMAASNCADFARIGILAWYYGIYNASSAMIAAKNGSFQEDHSGTAKLWDQEIAFPGLAMRPFSLRISSLLEKTYKEEIEAYRKGSNHKLIHTPVNINDAHGAIAGYLSGSAKFYAWKEEINVKKTREFKDLGVSDFRTKAARELRNKKLESKPIGFLHQSFRYRGKANYREALFLAYKKYPSSPDLTKFINDQYIVLMGFLQMAGAYASRKLGKDLWRNFLDDVEINRSFELSPYRVWSQGK